MIKIAQKGCSQSLRHLSRTHRVNICFIAERFACDPNIKIVTTKSDDQAADIYTKRFTDPIKWGQLLYLNGIVDPKAFWSSSSLDAYLVSQTGVGYVKRGGKKAPPEPTVEEIPLTKASSKKQGETEAKNH